MKLYLTAIALLLALVSVPYVASACGIYTHPITLTGHVIGSDDFTTDPFVSVPKRWDTGTAYPYTGGTACNSQGGYHGWYSGGGLMFLGQQNQLDSSCADFEQAWVVDSQAVPDPMIDVVTHRRITFTTSALRGSDETDGLTSGVVGWVRLATIDDTPTYSIGTPRYPEGPGVFVNIWSYFGDGVRINVVVVFDEGGNAFNTVDFDSPSLPIGSFSLYGTLDYSPSSRTVSASLRYGFTTVYSNLTWAPNGKHIEGIDRPFAFYENGNFGGTPSTLDGEMDYDSFGWDVTYTFPGCSAAPQGIVDAFNLFWVVVYFTALETIVGGALIIRKKVRERGGGGNE